MLFDESDPPVEGAADAPPLELEFFGFRRGFFFHAGVLQDVRPFPAGTGVAVFQMLSEMVGTEELLRVVTLSKLVHSSEMFESSVPVWLGEVGELFTAITARVVRRAGCCLA